MRPFSAAFLASNPAAIITDGLLVFVQLVIAAITTAPWPIVLEWPLSMDLGGLSDRRVVEREAALGYRARSRLGRTAVLDVGAASTRSCGRFGPARLGSTVPGRVGESCV